MNAFKHHHFDMFYSAGVEKPPLSNDGSLPYPIDPTNPSAPPPSAPPYGVAPYPTGNPPYPPTGNMPYPPTNAPYSN